MCADTPLRIEKISEDKQRFLPLLLIGDESETMIGRYLGRASLYVAFSGNQPVAVCAVTDEGPGLVEVKNLAVDAARRRRGIGRAMLEHVGLEHAGSDIILGTGETPSTLRFYRSCGFVETHRLPDFFTTHYATPIIEEGITLRDMIYLRKSPL